MEIARHSPGLRPRTARVSRSPTATVDLYFYGLVVIIFASLCAAGFYGYGIDYYMSYTKPNIDWFGPTDFLGFRIATLTIFNIHFGIFLTPLITATGLLVLYLSNPLTRYHQPKAGIYLSFVFLLHSWPIILGSLNVMRQGIAMAFIWICMAAVENRRYKTAFFFGGLATFTHKAGIFFVLILAMAFYIRRMHSRTFKKRSAFIIELSIFLTISLSFLYAALFILGRSYGIEQSRITANDLRIPLLVINVFMIGLWIFHMPTALKFSIIGLFCSITCLVAPALVVVGMNFEYERINMMTIIPMILVAASSFPRDWRAPVFVTGSVLFFFAAIVAGVYRGALY